MHTYNSGRHRKKLCKCSKVLVEFKNTVRILKINIIRMHRYEKDRRHYCLIKYFLRFKYFCQCSKKSHEEQIVSLKEQLALIG